MARFPGLTKARAGLYDGETERGDLVSVEILTTGYGDTGWCWWHNEFRSDYPMPAAAEAYVALSRYLDGIGQTIKGAK